MPTNIDRMAAWASGALATLPHAVWSADSFSELVEWYDLLHKAMRQEIITHDLTIEIS